MLRDMGMAVNKTANSVMIDKYVQKTALRLGVSAEAVRQEFRKLKATPERVSSEQSLAEDEEEAEAEVRRVVKPSSQEQWLLKLVMSSEEVLPQAATLLDLNWIQNGLVRQILQSRLTPGEDGHYPSVAALMGSLPDEESRRLVSETAVESRPIPNPLTNLTDLLITLRNQNVDRELEGLKRRLADPSVPDEERFALPSQINALRMQKKTPL